MITEDSGERTNKNILLRTYTYDGPRAGLLQHYVGKVLAPQQGANVPEVERRSALEGRLVGRVVQSEFLVVRGRVDLGGAGKEAGAVNRTVIEGCPHGIVLVSDERVSQIEEAIRGAR